MAGPGEISARGAPKKTGDFLTFRIEVRSLVIIIEVRMASMTGCVCLVKAVVTTFTHVGKRLRESNPGAHLGCEVPLER